MVRIAEDIPQDIVREVFLYFSSTLQVHEAQHFPWYLGHICASWRVTFLSMQSNFWKDIRLEWPDWRPERFPLPWYTWRVMEMLTHFLRCNQGSAFSFTLCTLFSNYTAEESGYVNGVLLILVSESSRWQDASMNLRASMLRTLRGVKHRLPLLRSLNLTLWSDDPNDHSIPELYGDIFETAPLLTSITVDRLSTWNFNWSSLTFVCLSDALNNSPFYIELSHATCLEGLEIDEPYNSHSEICPTRPLYLPCLVYLKIRSSNFLAMLKAPALVDLQIYLWEQELTPESNIVGFLLRSSCRLRHLCIACHNASTVKRILLHAPHIRYLCLLTIKNVSDIFAWLSSENYVNCQVSRPLARLEAFRIYGGPYIMEEYEIERLLDMVTSRALPNNLRTSIDGTGIQKLAIEEYGKYSTSQTALENLRFSCRTLGVEFQYPSHASFCKFCKMPSSYLSY